MKLGVAFVLLAACAGEADDPIDVEPAPVACNPAPAGFVAWRSGELVKVSKKLTGTIGGVQLRAEIHNISGDSLPSVVDFGAEQVEVRQDLSLCLVDG